VAAFAVGDRLQEPAELPQRLLVVAVLRQIDFFGI
jgi:hypothetical protein